MQRPIGVLGAAGVMGRLTTQRLLDRGIPLILAGRRAEALEALERELAQPALVRTLVVDARVEAQVAGLCAQVSVLLQCAGPYTDVGAPAVDAALATRTAILDLTGEQAWVRHSQQRNHAQALANGTVIGHAMGVEVALADCLAHQFAARYPQVTALQVSHAVRGFSSSPGSRLSALRISQSPSVTWRDRQWQPCVPGSLRATLPLQPPFATAQGAFLPGVELLTIPQHQPQLTTVTSFVALPSPLVWALNHAAPLTSRLPRSLLGNLAQRALSLVKQSPESTDAEAEFQIVVSAAPTTPPAPQPAERTLVLQAKAPYGLSADILALCAVRLRDVGPHAGHGGVLAPALVVDPQWLLETLQAAGLARVAWV